MAPEGRPYRPLVRDGYEDLSEAQSEIEAAIARGYEEGLARGREEALAELESQRAAYRKSIELLAGLRSELIKATRREIIDLALLAASRIVRHRIEDSDEVAVRIAEEALSQAHDRHSCTLRVHPKDLESLRQSELLRRERSVELLADPQIARGGVVVVNGEEEVDGRLETALSVLAGVVRDQQ